MEQTKTIKVYMNKIIDHYVQGFEHINVKYYSYKIEGDLVHLELTADIDWSEETCDRSGV